MAKQKNLSIDQGSYFSANLIVVDANNEPMNLAGYTAASQFRKYYDSANDVAFTATVVNTGIVILTLSANDSASVDAGRYVYDAEIEQVNTGIIIRISEGICT